MTNCINCGAPLHGRKCDYCGTEYNEQGNIEAEFDPTDGIGVINIMGQKFTCYVAEMEAITVSGPNAGRDMSGRMHRDIIGYKHKFTLVEI